MHRNTRSRAKLNSLTLTPSNSIVPNLPHDLPAPITSRNLRPRSRVVSSVLSATTSTPRLTRPLLFSASASSIAGGTSSQQEKMQHSGPRYEAYESGWDTTARYSEGGSSYFAGSAPSGSRSSDLGPRPEEMQPARREEPENYMSTRYMSGSEQPWNSGAEQSQNEFNFGGGYYENSRNSSDSRPFNEMQGPFNPPPYPPPQPLGEPSNLWRSMDQPITQAQEFTSYSPSYSQVYASNNYRAATGPETMGMGMGMGTSQWDSSTTESTFHPDMTRVEPQSSTGSPQSSLAIQTWPHSDIPRYGGSTSNTTMGSATGSSKRKRSSEGDYGYYQNHASTSVQRMPPNEAAGSSSNFLGPYVEASPEETWSASMNQPYIVNAERNHPSQGSSWNMSGTGSAPGMERSPYSNAFSPPFAENSPQPVQQFERPSDAPQEYSEPPFQDRPKPDLKGKGKARATPDNPARSIIEITDSPPQPPIKSRLNAARSAPPKKLLGDPLSSYTCPICFSPPTNATLTPCGHICCGLCLFAAVKTTMARSAMAGPRAGPPEARCPVCRATIKGWDGKGAGVIGLKARAKFSL